MADKTFSINVTTSSPKRVSVSSRQVANEITAGKDLTKYYSELAKNWAISSALVENLDYSAKYYAELAKISETNTKAFYENTQVAYSNFSELANGAIEELNIATSGSKEAIAEAEVLALTEIATTKNNAIEDIVTNNASALESIKEEGNKQVSNIERSGFYMRDDKLYFINSKGEEEEFKSGGARYIGELFHSLLPVKGTGAHLVDGALIDGSGSYAEFVNYVADVYENSETIEVTTNAKTIPTLTGNDNVTLVGTMYDGESWAYKVFPNSSGDTSWTTTSGSVTYTYNEVERPTAGTYKISLNHGSYNIANRTLNNVVVTLTFTDGTTQDISLGNFTGTIPTCSAYYESGVFAVNKTVASITLSHSGSTISTTTQCVQNLQLTQVTQLGKPAFCTEEEWQTSVTRYGVCGKFVYDSVANTVRLPKVTGFIEGTIDLNALGQLVEAGLPNVTGYGAKLGYRGIQTFSGAFYNDGTNGQEGSYGANFNVNYNVGFDASRSNPIYGNSSTVQPQSVKGYIYMVIATSTKTDVQVNLDNIATDLNGKADVDLSNTNDTAKVLMGRMGFPSNKYIDLTIGASGSTYTAPANGYFIFLYNTQATSATSWGLCVNTQTEIGIYPPAIVYAAEGYRAWCPALKGQTALVMYYNATPTLLRFVYAVGSESEAQ